MILKRRILNYIIRLIFFEDLFDRLVKFIKDKMFEKEKEREDYWKVSKDM